MKKRAILFLFIFSLSMKSQSSFEFELGITKAVIPFELINNLIFIPVNVNGVKLNFLLDSGVEETILFSLGDKEEVSFSTVEKIKLRGLGSNEHIEGLKSSNNNLAFHGLSDSNHTVYIVLDQDFNFSSHIGIPVNGIIGYHFFKNNLVEINYDRKKIMVYKESKKIHKKTERKFSALPMTLELNKPYVVTGVVQQQTEIQAKLLIDTGNSDAIWLFHDKSEQILLPEKNFEDFLGRGFSGDIHGKRGRISQLDLGSFEFRNPIAAFPDSVSIRNIKMVGDRVGSIGGEILKRFTVVFDYTNKILFLKKASHFNLPFQYNMSGIELQHSGLQWVQETVQLQTIPTNVYDVDTDKNKNNFKYKFVLKPIYTVANVRKDSPAERSGLKKGDIILSINKAKAYRFSLQQINSILKSEEGKVMELGVARNSQILKFSFRLKSIL